MIHFTMHSLLLGCGLCKWVNLSLFTIMPNCFYFSLKDYQVTKCEDESTDYAVRTVQSLLLELSVPSAT